MDSNRLSEFLRRAREEFSYESGASEARLPDGTRLIGPYTEGTLAYTDKYRGFERFEGQEEISENGKVVWFRKYEGGIKGRNHKSKKAAEKLYSFLKKALAAFPKDKPFKRGPFIFNFDLEFSDEAGKPDAIQSDYQYSDFCRGNMSDFQGEEQIFYKGRQVYALKYSGGIKTNSTLPARP